MVSFTLWPEERFSLIGGYVGFRGGLNAMAKKIIPIAVGD
jgi:hypothetical protein